MPPDPHMPEQTCLVWSISVMSTWYAWLTRGSSSIQRLKPASHSGPRDKDWNSFISLDELMNRSRRVP